MKAEGSSTTYVSSGTHTSIPVFDPAGPRVAHRPWCRDCKTKHDATDLDEHGRCTRCARAAVTRAEAAERRAAEDATRPAAPPARPVRPLELPKPGKQGQPTPPSSARRQSSTSGTSGRAPDAGPGNTEEKNPAAAQETRPAAAAGPSLSVENRATAERPQAVQQLDVDCLTATRALAATRDSHDKTVVLLRALALQALDVLADAHARTHQSAAAATPPTAAAPTSAAGTGKGKHTRRPMTPRRPRSTARAINETAIVDEYQSGDTVPTLATRHHVGVKRVRAILDRHHIERRDDRVGHSGGHNTTTFTPDQLNDLRHRYVEQHQTVATIAEQLGHHRRVITKALADAGVTMRPAAHLTGTVLTDEQRTEIVDRYAAGESMAVLSNDLHVRRQTIRDLVTAAGIDIRPKGNSTGNRLALDRLGITAQDIRAWARDAGIPVPSRGLVPSSAINAYAAAHPGADA